MENPVPPAFLAGLTQQFSRHFTAAHNVKIDIAPGDCRDAVADTLRQWCGENCHGRWKPVERWKASSVRIAFEDIADAVMFRLSF